MSSQALGPSGGGTGGLTYPYNLSFQSNASVAIIIVVLGATFFFMFLFLVYIKRCGGVAQSQQQGAGGAGDGRGGAGGWDAIHGLDPEVLKKFPIMRYASVKHKTPPDREAAECAVCLGQFEESERLRLLPACGHSFHPECIDMWLETHSTCPLCRRSLDQDAEIDVQQAVAVVVVAPPAADAQDGEVQQQLAVETAAPAAPQQEQASTVAIIRTLSRNSESFKSAAHEAELREVRERLRATSGRFGASSSPSSPSPLVRLLSRGGGSPSPSVRGGSCRPPVPPPPPSVAMATMHHSQSWSDLGLRSSAEPPETPKTSHQRDDDADLEAGSRSDRWTPSSSSDAAVHQSAH